MQLLLYLRESLSGSFVAIVNFFSETNKILVNVLFKENMSSKSGNKFQIIFDL